MTTTAPAPTLGPLGEADPFSAEILADPLPFQAALRDAGPVTHLARYDLYGMGRYAEVHAALVDWQRFCSAPGSA